MNFKVYLEIIRPSICLMSGSAVIIGAVISGAEFSILFLCGFFSVFLITAGGTVINDYYDLEIDKINTPHRPLPSGKISKEKALIYSLFLFILGIIFSAGVNIFCLALALFNTFLLIIYSQKLKQTVLAGNILVSWLTASALLFGAFITFNFEIVFVLALLAFFSILGREIFKDIEDIPGDKARGLKTLPIVVGSALAKKAAQLFIAITILLSPLPYRYFGLNYLMIIFFVDVLFFYSLFQSPTKAKNIIKIAMAIALAAFLLF